MYCYDLERLGWSVRPWILLLFLIDRLVKSMDFNALGYNLCAEQNGFHIVSTCTSWLSANIVWDWVCTITSSCYNSAHSRTFAGASASWSPSEPSSSSALPTRLSTSVS